MTKYEERIKELSRIARGHLANAVIETSGKDAEARMKRFDEIGAQKEFPYAKSHVIQAADRDAKRLDIEARFAACGAPLGEIGRWLPKRVLVLDEHDAIVEYVSNVDSDIQKKGDVCYTIVVNDDNARSSYGKLHEAMLHYLSSKYEGDNFAANRAFVRHAMAMLHYEG